MGLQRHLKHHQGAGILFARFRDGQWEVLLCQRRKSGLWSLAGGLKEKDESFLACAVREAHEEVGSPAVSSHERLPRVLSLRLPLILLWDTFLWVIEKEEPDFASDWPTTHCPEFRQVRWFPLANPPTPLYFLMKPTLFFARQTLRRR